MKRVVLAYSGGLDTSVAVRWLKERGFGVIAFMADVGQGGDFGLAKKRAFKAGASSVMVEDLREEFVRDFVFPTLKANAVYEGKYYLATALSRPLIAKGLVKAAMAKNAAFVSHGCTGKGNDQVRFEVSIGALNSKLKIIAPVREWEFPSREAQIRYAKQNKIPIDVTKKNPYSIDKNIWGMSIECGVLEDPWKEPPRDIYKMTRDPLKSSSKPKSITIGFKKGLPTHLNDQRIRPIDLIDRLNRIGGEYGIGRSDLVENRLVGIKSREIYEAPAASILIKAHEALESLTLDRELAHFKSVVSLKYAELIYYGLWYTQLKESLDKFIDHTQKNVTGLVKLKLKPGSATVVGRKSAYSLYRPELATYSKEDKFDQKLAKGFIELWGLPYKK